ncbi:MAG: prolyl oligopeptidase family serine peptidase, partial [Cytophagales bacterium]|nr:prolyl oligopeptidase family serine peptidase [Cytophagales bacterium]
HLQEIRVKKIYPFKKLPDVIRGVRFSSICWKGEGFFYSQYDSDQSSAQFSKEVKGPKLYYHRLGTDQAQDQLVYENKETTKFDFNVIENESLLLIRTTERLDGKDFGCLLYFDIKDSITSKYTNFLSYSLNKKNEYNAIGLYKNKILVFTNEKAPRGRLILVDPYPPFERSIFIPQRSEVLVSASIIWDKVVCTYLKDLDYSAMVYDTHGTEVNNIPFPVGAYVEGFQGTSQDSTTLFWYTSLLNPPIAYRYHVRSNSIYLIKTTVVKYDVKDFELVKVYCTSKDGTQIPMIIAKKVGLKLNGKLPTILYGYGGFGIVTTSFFDKGFMNHLHNNGIVAMVALRGGGEYGKDWHENGSGVNKQNSIDDFISAAEYLVSQNYTCKEKLAIMGGSNGGLLVAAVANQRPDICKVMVAEVGVYDLLRSNKYTVGKMVESEYGSIEDSVQFTFLHKYSPLHNISDTANYPAALIITADHDDRVVPMHSYKYAATLQAQNKGKLPILLYTVKDQGHYFWNDQIESYIYAFIYKNLGLVRKDVSYQLE